MRIKVKLDDGIEMELDAKMVVIQTLTPVKLAANNEYEVVVMEGDGE